MTIEKAKIFFIAIGTAISARLGLLATPVYILTLLMIIDYFTGLVAAPSRGESRSSHKGLLGIAKKFAFSYLWASPQPWIG